MTDEKDAVAGLAGERVTQGREMALHLIGLQVDILDPLGLRPVQTRQLDDRGMGSDLDQFLDWEGFRHEL